MIARRPPHVMSKLVPRASRRSVVVAIVVVGAAALTGCEWPHEQYAFVNETSGPVRLFFGSIDKGIIAPGESYTHPQRPVDLHPERWWFQGIDHEEQFAHAMRLGVTLMDEAGRRRSFDVTALRRQMTWNGGQLFTLHIRPDLFDSR